MLIKKVIVNHSFSAHSIIEKMGQVRVTFAILVILINEFKLCGQGDHVVSEITQASIDWITNLIQRPVYIWWNWPVNDLGRSHLMHLGPSEGLENNLENMSGLTSNPMNQAQASKVSLYSVADYTWNSNAYNSNDSWKSALKHIITDDEDASKAFEIFAQNCAAAPMSFAQTDESVYMQEDLNAFKGKNTLKVKIMAKEVEVVKDHFKELKDAITTLKSL